MQDDGYSFFQMIIVLYVISILLLLAVPLLKHGNLVSTDNLINEIGYCQYNAITRSEKIYYENQEIDNTIYFNRLGNSNMAQSIYFKEKRIIISLGTGRCYEKERWICDD